MNKHRKSSLYLFMVLLFLLSGGFLGTMEPGEAFPTFSVVSGDGKILINADLSDKIVFLFYEDRANLDTNQRLKSFLLEQAYSDDQVRIVVIADCTNAGLRKKFWESSLIDSSRKAGVTVYGDWNGRMKQSILAASDTSSFYILDRKGIVRYFMEGVVPEKEYQTIHSAAAP